MLLIRFVLATVLSIIRNLKVARSMKRTRLVGVYTAYALMTQHILRHTRLLLKLT